MIQLTNLVPKKARQQKTLNSLNEENVYPCDGRFFVTFALFHRLCSYTKARML